MFLLEAHYIIQDHAETLLTANWTHSWDGVINGLMEGNLVASMLLGCFFGGYQFFSGQFKSALA